MKSVTDATKFKICDMATPIEVLQLTTDTGNVMLSKGPNFNQTYQKIATPQPLATSITATGPGGTTTYALENEFELIIPEIWVPLFASARP